MKILVLGSGLMGPAAAYNALRDPEVERVTIADYDAHQLDAAAAKLSSLAGGQKLVTKQIDLSDTDSAIELFKDADAIIAALPWSASILAFKAALLSGTPIIDMAIPDDAEVVMLKKEAEAAGGLIVLGCGLEPGLTEIMARHLATRLDSVDELHIKCGGIPEVPSGPLGYKIVFGGRQLPLRQIEALVVEEGNARMATRYTGVEPAAFDGVGEVEAWHEGMMPWLLDLPEFTGITEGSQKTFRWPGYAAKAAMLNELGLLRVDPVDVGGTQVIPKQLVDALLYPHVKLEEGEGDITLFRVDLIGMKDGKKVMWRADMVDRYDRELGFTSMARTTAFTGAIITRMIARGDFKGVGLYTADGVVTDELYSRLERELAENGIDFTITSHEIS